MTIIPLIALVSMCIWFMWKFRKETVSKKNALDFKSGFDLTEIPVVTFFQDGKKINFVLDTGASSSVLNASAADSLKLKYTIAKEISTLFGIEGNKQVHPTIIVPMTYKNLKFEVPFLAKDMDKCFAHVKKENGVTIHGMLGSDFFNKYKYVIDFNELIAYSKK